MAGRLNDADLRATIEGEVLGVVSGHGGERIVAGPEMYQLVQELTDLVLNWRAAVVRAVLERHQPYPTSPRCITDDFSWPCPTVEAISREITRKGESDG